MLWLLPQLIDRASDHDPQREALRHDNGSLTYGQVAARSNQLAHLLVAQGVKRGDRVGICLYKGFDMILSAYAVMKAGAAYVPLDPFAPEQRLTSIVEDCGVRVVLTQREKGPAIARVAAAAELETVIGLSELDAPHTRALGWEAAAEWAGDAGPDRRLVEDDLAYIIYTSGSTGKPKGIVHTHRSGMAFIRWATDVHRIHAEDRFSNHSPLHFDMSMLEFYGAAYKRAVTVIIPEEHKRLPASYSKLLEEERITVFYTVPFTLSQLLARGALELRDLSSIRWVIFGGENFEARSVRQLMGLMPQARFSHVYGPTEANACTYWHLPSDPEEINDPMSIGRDCPNGESILVDEGGEEIAGEGMGELLLRGPAVMQGYWNRPDLNKAAFVTREQAGRPVTYLRTGDVLRRGGEGEYYFIGRIDSQVKIRGFRIELAEIEEALRELDEVGDVIAFSQEDELGNPTVVAAVTGTGSARVPSGEVLIERVRGRLPPYALPREILSLEGMPRTSSGKIDVQKVKQLARANPSSLPWT